MNDVINALPIIAIIHLSIFLIVLILKAVRVIKTRSLLLAEVLLIPVFGLVMLLIDEYCTRRSLCGRKRFDLEELKITDQIFRNIRTDGRDNSKITVPLEEAMLMNNAGDRRALMMDILYREPEKYIALLHRISGRQDTEMTHYSTTALAELQADYEKKVGKAYREHIANPLSIKYLKAYCDVLEKYSNSGLISGNLLELQRQSLDRELEKLLNLVPNERRFTYMYIKNKLAMNNKGDIEQTLLKTKEKWPNDERIHILYHEYYREKNDPEGMRRVIDNVQKNQIYLSREARKWYDFWRGDIA